MGTQECRAMADFFVGQEGEFALLDSFSNLIEMVNGRILRLMAGENAGSVYALIITERGIRPARLA